MWPIPGRKTWLLFSKFLSSSARHVTNSCPVGLDCGHDGPNLLKGKFTCPKQWSWRAELPNGPSSDRKIEFSCPSDQKNLPKKTKVA